MISYDALEQITRVASQGEDPWEMMVAVGLDAQERLDTGRWLIGDLALLIPKQYGSDRLGEFAKAIRVEVARAREYRTVARFWDRQSSARAEILATYASITYSHMREAMRLGKPEAARDFIEECAAEAWSVEAARLKLRERLGKPAPLCKLMDAEATIQNIREDMICFRAAREDLHNPGECWLKGVQRVRLVLYEVRDANYEMEQM